MNRLTERDWKDKCAGYMWTVHPVKDIDDLPYYKRLAEYEDLEEQGKILKLPCPIGTVVYRVYFSSIHNKDVYSYISVKFDYEHIKLYRDGYIFLLKEDAEREKSILNETLKKNLEDTHVVRDAVFKTNEFWMERRKRRGFEKEFLQTV